MFFLGLQDRKESKIGVSVNPDAQNLGKIHVGLIAAKDLIKTDLVGKSSHGNQKFKTNAIKNTQDPEWNYDVDFNVPDGGDNTIKIDIFDEDRFGKDKSLGSAIMDVDEVMARGIVPPGWYPLKGVKSGQVLMSADFDAIGSSRLTSPDRSLIGIDDAKDPLSTTRQKAGGGKELKNRLNSKDQLGVDKEDETQEGMLHIDLLGARNLIKADMIGKADPYGTLKLGDQQFKTDTVKNSQNPEWNYGVDFIIDDSTPPEVLLNIYDHDKLGKDKPLGNVTLSVGDLIERSKDPNAGPVWIPLSGVKSGEILVDTNFIPEDQLDMNRRMSGHGKGRQNVGHPDNAGLLKKKDSSRSFQGENQGDIPDGNVHVSLIKAKNLTKSDLIGKSDPYGVISCGNDKSKTKVIKNDQNPEFNHEAYFPVNNEGPRNIKIELFDSDKIGSNKPLGSANIDIADIASNGPIIDKWLPLKNSKNGEVMISADFQPKFGDDNEEGRRIPGHLSSHKDGAGGGKGLRDKLKTDSKKPSGSQIEDLIPGNLHLDLLQAKDLIKADMIGKSDPYAVVTASDEKAKTKTVKNSQNPEWNFSMDIPIDVDGSDNIKIDVFDKDKIGKDKPLGSASFNVAELQKGGNLEKEWVPLNGVKTGKLQVSTDFTPGLSDKTEGGQGLPSSNKQRKDSDMSIDEYNPNSRKQSILESGQDSEIPAGNVHLHIHEGKDLSPILQQAMIQSA